MALSLSHRLAIIDADEDIAPALESIQRERWLKLAAVLAGLVALVLSLGVVAYLNLAQQVDPGPPAPPPASHPGVTSF